MSTATVAAMAAPVPRRSGNAPHKHGGGLQQAVSDRRQRAEEAVQLYEER